MPISENLKSLKEKSGAATLVAVSKQQPMERIREALDAGHRHYGENRVQEAFAHWADLKPAYADLCLHLIGPLQTNKVKDALALFDVIETLDREKLAAAITAELQKTNRPQPKLFVQVNTGLEEQKSGVTPDNLSHFLALCRDHYQLKISGLMCIPPQDEPPALHFALLKKLADAHDLPERSMGMSGDFEKAVALGATSIRLGSAVFGERLIS